MSMAQNDWRPYWIIGKKKPLKINTAYGPKLVYIYFYLYDYDNVCVCV